MHGVDQVLDVGAAHRGAVPLNERARGGWQLKSLTGTQVKGRIGPAVPKASSPSSSVQWEPRDVVFVRRSGRGLRSCAHKNLTRALRLVIAVDPDAGADDLAANAVVTRTPPCRPRVAVGYGLFELWEAIRDVGVDRTWGEVSDPPAADADALVIGSRRESSA